MPVLLLLLLLLVVMVVVGGTTRGRPREEVLWIRRVSWIVAFRLVGGGVCVSVRVNVSVKGGGVWV